MPAAWPACVSGCVLVRARMCVRACACPRMRARVRVSRIIIIVDYPNRGVIQYLRSVSYNFYL